MLAALGLPALALVQCAASTTAARQWTCESALLTAAFAAAILLTASGRVPAARLAAAILLACALQAGFGAVQWSQGSTAIYGRRGDLVTAPFGSFVNHNHFASFVQMGALLGFGTGAGLLRLGRVPLGLATCGLSVGLVFTHLASRSRGGLLALAGGGALLVLLLGAQRLRRPSASGARRALLLVVAFAMVAAVAWVVVPARTRAHLATITRAQGEGALLYRLDVARAALGLVADRPIVGWGLGSFSDVFPRVKSGHGEVRTLYAENEPLQLLCEGGLLAWAWAALVGMGVARGTRAHLRSREPLRAGIAAGAAAAVGAALLHSLLDFGLRIPAPALLFACLVGFLLSGLEGPQWRMAPWARGAWLLLAGLCLWRAAGAVQVNAALREPSPQVRVIRLAAVVQQHPYHTEARRHLAWTRLQASERSALLPFRARQAEHDLLRALDSRPMWAEAWVGLAWARWFAGQRAGARAAAVRAAELDPGSISLGTLLAELRARLDGPAAAIAELERVLHRNPRWPAAAARAAASRWTQDPTLLARLADRPSR